MSLPADDDLASGIRRIPVDAMEGVAGILASWFGEAPRPRANPDEE
jgi:hypothetical protein